MGQPAATTGADGGVARGATAQSGARLSRRGGRWLVDTAEPRAAAASEPTGFALSDAGTLYRRLDLPSAEDDQLDQMVRAQLEVIAPVPVDALAWCAVRTPDGGVLVAAARRERLSEAPHRALVVAAASAVDLAWRHLFHQDAATALVVRPLEGVTALLVVEPRGLLAAATAAGEPGPDAGEAERTRWGRDVAAAARRVIAAVPEAQRPSRCVVLAEHADATAAALGALGLPLVEPRLAQPGAVAAADVLTHLEAVGAALASAEAGESTLVLSDAREQAGPAGGRVPRRLLAAAAIAAVGVAGLYTADLWAASRQPGPAASAPHDRAQTAQRLAIARYLIDRPPPPLFAIAAISDAAPHGLQVKRFEYDAAGRVRFSGEAQGITPLDATLSSLTRTPPLTGVEMRSASVERDKWAFDAEGSLVPLHRHVATAPPVAPGITATSAEASP